MIRLNGKNIGAIRTGSRAIGIVKAGAVTVWRLARACFSGKMWRYNRPWLYKDKWKYGKNK